MAEDRATEVAAVATVGMVEMGAGTQVTPWGQAVVPMEVPTATSPRRGALEAVPQPVFPEVMAVLRCL